MGMEDGGPRPISPPHGWVKPHPWCGNLPQLLFLVSFSLPGVILSLQEGSLCSSLRLIQDIAILFNIIIIFLMFFNTFVFQAGLVNLLFHKFKGTIVLSAAYLVLSIAFHIWIMLRRGRIAALWNVSVSQGGSSASLESVGHSKERSENLRWKNSTRFVWTDGLQALFVFQRLVAVLYCYFYKRTALHLGDPRFYQDSLWLRKEFAQVRS
ncbi:transmembrane protein 138 isoform X2 [Trachemys scripta elegans]|uniref:transmembrane protein 138 isoform X2 n=1 Tax=Trachemys scripta elegans TaxID=31138 RepID=UPI001553647F|nr:transmembrane protein 138 isoform X2 [Trachemys scripta elegans]